MPVLIQPEDKSGLQSLEGIPLLDFSEFGDGSTDASKRIAEEFYTACRDVGFAYILGLGIEPERVQDMFGWSKKLFDLPSETKMLAPHPPEGWWHRGYSGVGAEQVSQMVFDPAELAKIRQNAPDFKESYEIGNEEEKVKLNIWLPEEKLPGFRRYANSFFAECAGLSKKLLMALAMGMKLDKDFLLDYHLENNNQLRLLHYPEAPRGDFDSGKKGRINAHTDFGTCTMLFQDEVGGLEVESPARPGVFLPAPPVKGAIVFNIGDFCMRWSNDELKSTLHRVRAPPPKADDTQWTRARYSIPYFVSADGDKQIDAMPGTVTADRPKKYEPITSKDYLSMRLNATYVK